MIVGGSNTIPHGVPYVVVVAEGCKAHEATKLGGGSSDDHEAVTKKVLLGNQARGTVCVSLGCQKKTKSLVPA